MTPAAVDSMMSVRETPWHQLGVVLDKHPASIDEAITLSGLDWEVEQKTIYIDGRDGLGPMRGYLANVRNDTEEVLGVVTKRYQPVQNRSAFEFLAAVFGSELHFETAGSLLGGRRAWVMMKLPDWIEVGGDSIGQYAFIANSHDGKSSVLAAMTPIRIVCNNTLTAAVNRAKGGDASRTYSIRHIGDMSAKIAEARNVLQVTVNFYEQFKKFGDKLALVPIKEDRALGLTEKLIPIEAGQGDRAAKNREEAREAVMHLFKEGTVVDGLSTLGNSPGTAWGWYNAATEYADWYRGERKEGGRFTRIIDDPDSMKDHAWKLALTTSDL